ncbi:MAG: amidohydrolase [Deltaproteobacteria bacterium]|uniref:Amidohydrolase n=1 Tax=Candidatus Desulfacyla euxinica TaxID=2841693 RepID=A0A8J6MZF2_9DELT|nr:amidohydrolase [Candidatus Desulfacyla euxinica]
MDLKDAKREINPGDHRNDGSLILGKPLPALHDAEGNEVPESLPPIVDAHVHLFPEVFFRAIWRWFDQFGWPIRYKLKSAEVLEFLLARGLSHIVGLHYAHKPGVARKQNSHMIRLCRKFAQLSGAATVFPGEKDAKKILADGFRDGLCGVKLHSHVQCFDMDSEGMHEIYRVCMEHDKPLVMHVGREPRSPASKCDSYLLCSAAQLEKVIRGYPELKVCVPHLGGDEFKAYQRLIRDYDNLWLDTTMTLAGYMQGFSGPPLEEMRVDRIMYGSDFPQLPYAWDRELKKLSELGLSRESLRLILNQNAIEFFSIKGFQESG